MLKEILIATSNNNKLKEIALIMKPLNVKCLADFESVPEIIEDGQTFEENAQKKAQIISKYFNCFSLADDSGIEIDYLNGEPGVYSARYGGGTLNDIERCCLVLEKMKEVRAENKRHAKFVCVVTIAEPKGNIIKTIRGECKGVIIKKMKGNNGFGYDPIFFVPQMNCTMAELSTEVKNKISHRGIAFSKAREFIISEL